YMIDDMGGAVTELAGGIDVDAVSSLVDNLDSILPQDARATGEAIDDISAALGLMARDDDRMSRVILMTRELTGVLVSQEQSISALTDQSLVLVTVLTQRREALSAMVASLDDLAARVSSLLEEESDDVNQVLLNMRSISETYQRNIDVMDEVLTRMPPG